jgi:hypothetical protein
MDSVFCDRYRINSKTRGLKQKELIEKPRINIIEDSTAIKGADII